MRCSEPNPIDNSGHLGLLDLDKSWDSRAPRRRIQHPDRRILSIAVPCFSVPAPHKPQPTTEAANSSNSYRPSPTPGHSMSHCLGEAIIESNLRTKPLLPFAVPHTIAGGHQQLKTHPAGALAALREFVAGLE